MQRQKLPAFAAVCARQLRRHVANWELVRPGALNVPFLQDDACGP